jgi:hypothetical protein
MTGKNKKELQLENSQLKEELNKWKIDFGKVSETRTAFGSNCDKTLKNVAHLEKHKKQSTTTIFKCDHCEKEFNEK